MQATNAFDAYGNRIAHTGTSDSLIGYSGNWTDPDTALVYYRARDYDPRTSQFLTVDPAVDATRQPYAYTANNPLAMTDPSGLCPRTGHAGACTPGDFGTAERTISPFGNFLGDIASGPVGRFLIGLGDGASFGATNAIRDAVNPVLNCTFSKDGFYYGGMVTGVAATTIALAGAGSGAEATAGSRVFWSGGNLAKGAAEDFAGSTGRTTLEMTSRGRALEQSTAGMEWESARPLWENASANFARGLTPQRTSSRTQRGSR